MKGKWEGKLIFEESKKSKDNSRLMQIPLEIKVITESLKNNFLFQVSLGSKELFHSNLLAWLLEQRISSKPDSFILEKFLEYLSGDRSFLGNEDRIKEFKVLREVENIDLMIKWRVGNELFITLFENKVKSIPTADQLKRYTVKTKKIEGRKSSITENTDKTSLIPIHVKGKYLLTMSSVEDSEISKQKDWINITYSNQILNFLNSIIDFPFENSDVQLVIRKYISLLQGQVAILKHFCLVSVEDNSFFERPYDFYSKDSVVSILRSIRLHDLVLKLIHHKIAKEVEMRISNMGLKLKRSESEFTNATGITSVDIALEKEYIVGIQLQGNQFRLYTIHKEAKLNEQFALELWRNKLWFYDLSTHSALIGSGRRKSHFQSYGMKDEFGNNRSFCEYDQGVFLYLYKDLSKGEVTLSVNKVVDLFVQYLSHLNCNIDEFIAATKKQ